MTIPEHTPDTKLDDQELTNKNLEEVRGGAASPKLFTANTDERTNAGGHGGDG